MTLVSFWVPFSTSMIMGGRVFLVKLKRPSFPPFWRDIFLTECLASGRHKASWSQAWVESVGFFYGWQLGWRFQGVPRFQEVPRGSKRFQGVPQFKFEFFVDLINQHEFSVQIAN